MADDTPYVRGAERLKRRIESIRRKTALPPLTDEIGGLLLKRTMERFDRQVDPDGKPWRPLAPATVLRRRQLGLGPEPKLVRTRALRDSIKLIRGSVPGSTYTNTGAGVRIGIEDPEIAEYGAVQNRGDKAGRIPARRFLGIGRLDVKAVDSLLRRKARSLEAVE